MFIIRYKKIFISISVVLVVLSLSALLFFGLRVCIDFKGGTILEVVYKAARPDQESLASSLDKLSFGSILLQPTGELGYIVKTRDLNDSEHAELLKTLSENNSNALTEISFNS